MGTEEQDHAFLLNFQMLLDDLKGVRDVGDVTECMDKNPNYLTLLQWRLRILINKHSSVDLEESTSSIWSDRELLELLLTSGDVLEDKWGEALNILAYLADVEPRITLPDGSPYLKHLAVAVALTFSTPVKSFASYDTQNIDPVQRFKNYVAWCEDGVLFPVHETLNAWLLRYVIASWAEDDELVWARANIDPSFKSPEGVGEATHAMVSYREHNHAGISIHDGAPYYDNKPLTLAILHEYGAVCGGVSKFGTAMAQAFGIPACPIAQPGHCAFLWWKEGDWVMSNGNSGITESTTHEGIQWTWNKRCDYQLLFDKAQKIPKDFIRSETHRWTCALIGNVMTRLEVLNYASELSPSNYAVWKDLKNLCSKISSEELPSEQNEQSFAVLEQLNITNNQRQLISSNALVSASVENRMGNVIDGTGSEWYCQDEEGWIELDLHQLYHISCVEIQWWGISVSKQYEVHVADSDGTFTIVRTQKDEYVSPQDYNEWSKLHGWRKATRKIRILMREGHLDPWGMNVRIGVRQIKIFGSEFTPHQSHGQSHGIVIPGDEFPPDLSESVEQWLRECDRKIDSCGTEVLSRFAVVSSSVPERAENVVDGTGSEWYCKDKEGWLVVDLGSVCKITDLQIQWWGISASKSYQIFVAGDSVDEFVPVRTNKDEYETPSGEYNEWSKCPGWDNPTSRVKIVMTDGSLDPWNHSVWIGVRQVNIIGKDITSTSNDEHPTLKGYLRRKIRKSFNDFPKIGKELLSAM